MKRMSTTMKVTLSLLWDALHAIQQRTCDGVIVRLRGVEYALTGFDLITRLARLESADGVIASVPYASLTTRKSLSF